MPITPMIESISAVTLATYDMARVVRFCTTLGFDLIRGGADANFTGFRAGTDYLNLTVQPERRHMVGSHHLLRVGCRRSVRWCQRWSASSIQRSALDKWISCRLVA